MATTFPRFILIKPWDRVWEVEEVTKGGFFACKDDDNSVVVASEGGVFNPLAKIEVEFVEIDSTHTPMWSYFHLRFCHNNKYWSIDASGKVVAEFNKKSRTLFKSKVDPTQTEVFTGWHFYLTDTATGLGANVRDSRLVMSGNEPNDLLQFVDWETIVQLPKSLVALKGDNGKYLEIQGDAEGSVVQFSSDDPNSRRSVFMLDQKPDGHVEVFSRVLGFHERFSWANEDNSDGYSLRAVRINDDTVAIQRGRFHYIADDNDGIQMGSTFTREARMQVQELVLERKIYNVRYRMDRAQIINEKAYLAGKNTAINNGDEAGYVTVEITYQDQTSHTYTHNTSFNAGVSATIEARLPFVEDATIDASFSESRPFRWGDTITTTTSGKVTYTVPMLGRTKAVVRYVGTKGTRNIPFTYHQRDRRSTDGEIFCTEHDDGIYTGVSCYDFNFVVMDPTPLN